MTSILTGATPDTTHVLPECAGIGPRCPQGHDRQECGCRHHPAENKGSAGRLTPNVNLCQRAAIDAKETRVNLRPGERLVIVLHDLPGYARWQCACSIGRELSLLLGAEVTFESDKWEKGRPR